jgi:hypothetical protein
MDDEMGIDRANTALNAARSREEDTLHREEEKESA